MKLRSIKNKKVAIFTSMALFTACSHTPRGQVVHLDEGVSDNNSESVAAKPADNTIPLYTQKEKDNLSVPAAKDDAAVYYFSLGQAFSLDNDATKAIEAYRATLVYDPNSALVHARLAAELIKQGNYAEARTLCEKSIELDPKYVDSYLLLAGIQVAAKEYGEALVTYKKALSHDPENRDALLYYGVTLAETGKTQAAVAVLNKLVLLKDKSDSTVDQSVSYYYLAKVEQEARHKEAAIAALEKSLEKRPGFAKAALLEAELLADKPKKAQAVLEQAFEENHQAELAERLAEIYLAANDYKGAVVYLETLAEEDPGNENVHLRLALVYWQLEWLDKAHLALSDLHTRFPESNEINFYLGEIDLERKDSAEAISFYKLVSTDYVKYEQVVARVISLYRADKKYEEAEAFVKNAIEKRGDIIAFYPLLAALYEDEEQLSKAKDILEAGNKIFDKDESILYYLGFIYDRLGNKEKSFALMQQLLVVNPNNANALNFVGYTLLESGKDMAKADEYLRHAFAVKPDDAYVLDSYGWLLYKEGKHKAAMVYLERAFNNKPEEALIAEHLADTYVALHLPEKALLVYQKAAALNSSDEEGLKSRVELKIQNVRNAMASGSRLPASIP